MRTFEIEGQVLQAEKVETGRYDITLKGVGRIGEVSGAAGNWAAFYRGKPLTSYNSIGDAVKGILNSERTRR